MQGGHPALTREQLDMVLVAGMWTVAISIGLAFVAGLIVVLT